MSLALVAGLGAWGLSRLRPLARLELPAGGTVVLESVTNASSIQLKAEPSPSGSWWKRMKERFSRRTFTLQLQAPGPTFIFSGGAMHRGELIEKIEVIRTFFDENRASEQRVYRPIDLSLERPIEQRVSRAGSITTWENPVFPRREKTFRTQVRIGTEWYDWELPNPLYGRAISEWTPEEFPIKRVIGDIEYTAVGWRPGNFGPYLRFEVRHQGKRVAWPVTSSSSKLISDATGNVSSELLSVAEPAWKIQHTITTGKQAPLSSKHKVTLANVQVPPGAEDALKEVDGIPFVGLTVYFGHVGAGKFCFVNGEPAAMDAEQLALVESGAAMAESVLRCATSTSGKGWMVFGTAKAPVFLFVIQSARSPERIIEHGYWKGGEWKDFRTLNQNGTGTVKAMLLQAAEPAGTSIDVDLFWHEEFSVEMFVKPPPLSLWAEKPRP